MRNVFSKTIDGWDSWSKVYQSIDDFSDLIYLIFKKEEISNNKEITRLTPGTNAVFRVGDYVIKIFAPKESGHDFTKDYYEELNSMKRAERLGILVPSVIKASSIRDKYHFNYIIMKYINGEEAGHQLKNMSSKEKVSFAHNFRNMIRKLNQPVNAFFNIDSIRNRAINNFRWNNFDGSIKEELKEIVSNIDKCEGVYVHGDLTADNIMVRNQEIYILDFADSLIAPHYYEFPPIVFDLFDYDKILINAYYDDIPKETFIDWLFKGIMIHDFGSHFVKDIYKRLGKKEISKLHSLNEIRELLYNYFGS